MIFIQLNIRKSTLLLNANKVPRTGIHLVKVQLILMILIVQVTMIYKFLQRLNFLFFSTNTKEPSQAKR